MTKASQRLGALVALTLFLAAIPTCARQMSAEDELLVGELQTALSDVQRRIGEAKSLDSTLAGGLVKALVAVRLEILRTNAALIEQRIHALKSGATIRVEAAGYKTDPTRASRLETEIAQQETSVATAKTEAARYSGGLVYAMAMSRVATEENTLAMLRQAWLSAKYGLAMPTVQATGTQAMRDQEILAPEVDQPKPRMELVEVDARVTERNSSWSKYAWVLTVKNLTSERARFNALVEFLDADGFVIDDAREYGLEVDPYEERTFRGYALIDAAVAGNVSSVSAEVGPGV